MASKTRPYERFGSFLLLRKLENDSISELWRAAEIGNEKLGETVALRRFTGGDRAAFRVAAEHARSVVTALTGTTVARGQKLGFVGDIPYLTHEYIGGRSLRMILDRAQGGEGTSPSPLPLDQALAITEKLASSCEMLASVKYQGARLVHGALIPQFVWVSDEGEVRTAGQQFNGGVVASLGTARELAGYFAPEIRKGAQPTKSSDVWALGAVLYLTLTGDDLTGSNDPEVIKQALDSAKLAHRDEPIPADIRPLLDQSLRVAPEERFPSAAEMRQALDKLLNGGEYSPTTFNLAFYLHSLLKKDMEAEAAERPREAEVDLAAYPLPAVAVAPAPAVAPAVVSPPRSTPAPEPMVAAPFGGSRFETPRRSKLPLVIAGAVIAIGAGAFVALGPKTSSSAQVTTASALPISAPKPVAPIQPIVAAVPGADPTSTITPADPEARARMIEEAVNKRLQEEMMKLQERYDRDLQSKQAAQAPRAATVPAPRPREDNAPSAAELDAQRRQAAQAVSRPAQTETAAPSLPVTPTAVAEPAPVVAAAPQVRQGDLVAINELDQIPELRSPVRPNYPPLAAKQRKEATIIVSALINEDGRVTDVRILRGDPARVGFDDAAMRAVRSGSFTPPMKDGKRVKTWKPLPIIFKLQ